MQSSAFSQKPDEMRAFDKDEWKQYDFEHFGKDVIWDTVFYYVEAEEDNRIVGTMELKIEAGIGKVTTLLVAKSNQRKGVGKALMQKAEEITKQQNGHKLFLTTGKTWEALKFYQTIGFQITGELRDHYFHVDFVELTKFL